MILSSKTELKLYQAATTFMKARLEDQKEKLKLAEIQVNMCEYVEALAVAQQKGSIAHSEMVNVLRASSNNSVE